jgi:hypothetical protein
MLEQLELLGGICVGCSIAFPLAPSSAASMYPLSVHSCLCLCSLAPSITAWSSATTSICIIFSSSIGHR